MGTIYTSHLGGDCYSKDNGEIISTGSQPSAKRNSKLKENNVIMKWRSSEDERKYYSCGNCVIGLKAKEKAFSFSLVLSHDLEHAMIGNNLYVTIFSCYIFIILYSL